MKRTKPPIKTSEFTVEYTDILPFKERADAIITSDWHLREDIPTCRTDNYIHNQWDKVRFVKELQRKHNCPVFHGGDLYNYWKPSPELLSLTIMNLPKMFLTILGNHDLPQHNIELLKKCGVYTLWTAGALEIIPKGINWGQKPFNLEHGDGGIWEYKKRKILIWHTMTYQGKKPWPDCPIPKAAKLLRMYPEYDLIITGHNHQSFIETHENRILINPGSILRMDVDQVNHIPQVYLWYANENKIIPVKIPFKQNVISREHIEIVENRNERIEKFISTLKTKWTVSSSFESNLEKFLNKNKTKKSIKNIIYKAIESNN